MDTPGSDPQTPPPNRGEAQHDYVPLSAAARGLIFAGLLVVAMGQTVLFAILGPLGRQLALSEFQVGAIISLSALTVVAFSPWWGRRSDRIGRKPVFVFSAVGFAITTLLFVLLLGLGMAGWIAGWTAFVVLVAGRVAYALVIAGNQPAAAGFIADTTPPEARAGAMAIFGGAFGVGSILGPATAFFLAPFGVLFPLYAVSIIGFAVALLCWRFLPESPRARPSEADGAKLSPMDRRILPIIAGVVAVFAAVAMVQQTLAFFVQDLGGLSLDETAQRTGGLFAMLSAANLLAIVVVARSKPAPFLAVLGGGTIGALGAFLLLLAPLTPLALPLGLVAMGIGFSALFPGLQSSASVVVGADEQGAAAGYVSAAMAGGFILGPLAGPALYMVNSGLTFALAGGLLLLGAAIAGMGARKGNAPDEPAGSTQ